MKELLYVEIEEILHRAVECAEYYQKEYLNTKIFALYLANGDRIKQVINPANVPHLLGIDIYALKGIINFNGDNAIEMLKDLLDRVQNGLITTKQAARESMILSNLLKAYEQTELQGKIEALETIVEGRT